MDHIPEKDFRKKVEKRLSKYFNLFHEQKGEYFSPSGKRSLKRLDLVIQHKEEKWLVFGIEFKHNGKKTGNDLGKACNQMRMYSYIKWNYKNNAKKWGQIPIIACPHISLNYLQFIRGHQHNEGHVHNNVNSFLAEAFNIGEVRPKTIKNERLVRFFFNNKLLWGEFGFDSDFSDRDNYEKIGKQKLGDYIHIQNYPKIIRRIQGFANQNYAS